jgi:acetolactate synthase-1/2/3 large subunit
LGFGFNTALGVKAAHPDKAVVAVSGDGGFLFGAQELATAVQHRINLVTVVFNNSSYGNVRRDQMEQYQGRLLGAELHNPDFVRFSESFGAMAMRAASPSALKEKLQTALEADSPVVIEVPIERGSETSPWPFTLPPPHA